LCGVGFYVIKEVVYKKKKWIKNFEKSDSVVGGTKKGVFKMEKGRY
jgi:hypothetical protein